MPSSIVSCVDAAALVRLMVARCTVYPSSWGNSWGNWSERSRALLHHADPLLAVEPQIAVGDHGADLHELVLGAKDQRGGASDGGAHLVTRRIERRGAGRVRVGEAGCARPTNSRPPDFRAPASAASSRRGASVWASSAMRSSDWIGGRWSGTPGECMRASLPSPPPCATRGACPMSYRDEVLPASVESWISTTSGFLVAPDFDVAERVAGARCRVPSVSVSVGLMSSDGKARIPSCVTTSPTSSLWSSPRLFAGAPSKMVRRASRMGLSCSLKLSTSTPRGYADRLWVVCTTGYVAIDQSSDRVDRNLLLPHPVR